jgi:predicted CXXCH cytochrome family protein
MRLVRKCLPMVAVLVFAGIRLQAAVHPVPIKADSDCASCHKDKTQGRDVHPAVQMGCTLCHAIVDREGATYVELQGGGVPALCFQCHADKKAGAQVAAHPLKFESTRAGAEPRAAECTACHTPHASKFPHLLIKGEYGRKGENLCLDCHDKGENVPKGGSRHMALETGCDTCHVLHKQGNPATEDGQFQLKANPPHLCAQCHYALAPELVKAHHNLPYATAVCTDCHDPHSSNVDFLLLKHTHAPFAAGNCESCHTGVSGTQLTFVNGGGDQLCLSCHAKAKEQHAGVTMTQSCTSCHSPHASRAAALIRNAAKVSSAANHQ